MNELHKKMIYELESIGYSSTFETQSIIYFVRNNKYYANIGKSFDQKEAMIRIGVIAFHFSFSISSDDILFLEEVISSINDKVNKITGPNYYANIILHKSCLRNNSIFERTIHGKGILSKIRMILNIRDRYYEVKVSAD